MPIMSPNQQCQFLCVKLLESFSDYFASNVGLAYSDFNQTPLMQHIYPPHHVVRIRMLDSQQSRRTSN